MTDDLEVKEYTTTDFYTAAVLISQDFRVIKVSNADNKGKVKKFHFEDSDDLHRVRMDYVNGVLEGNVRKFKNAIETVKDMIHSS